jgi:ABC-2 type transport system permease protein
MKPVSKRVWIIYKKELKDVTSSKSLLLTMLLSPVIVLGLAVLQLVFTPPSQVASRAAFIIIFLSVLYPLGISAAVSMDSFVGERTRRTIEPLLASPISDVDLFLGKVLASFIPAIAVSYSVLMAYSEIAVLRAPSSVTLILSAPNIARIVWQAPTLALLGTCIITIISCRISDPKMAMQVSNYAILGMFFLFLYITTTSVGPDLLEVVLINSGITSWTVFSIWLGGKVFSRENVLSRV